MGSSSYQRLRPPVQLGDSQVGIQARGAVPGFDVSILPNANPINHAARQTRRPSRFRARCIIPRYAAKVGTLTA